VNKLAKGFGVSIPDLALYGVLGYVGFVLLKPLLSTANSVSDIVSIPSDIINSVKNNPTDFIRNAPLDFWNIMGLGIPKALHLY
jgi:hypothetical protein